MKKEEKTLKEKGKREEEEENCFLLIFMRSSHSLTTNRGHAHPPEKIALTVRDHRLVQI